MFKSVLIAVFILASRHGLLHAATSDTFQVSATIEDGCLVNGAVADPDHVLGIIATMDFGSVPVTLPTAVSASLIYQSTFTLSCTPGITMNVSVNGGTNQTDGSRHLKHQSEPELIAYQLYRDAAKSQALAIGVAYPVDTSSDPDDIKIFLWGLATITGNEPAGTYSDALTLTLSW
ncbi:spore coat U domain-containing protein [Photobacterium sp. TY1-4]|uniref:Csu type fimbrial protein n=1 Tax=Photobacterium sp. TY1-4 TaxID=2899122 RepID=UPI0021C0D928|nr:spore coat U domain-containing protein [Photobacterium sp. TY1-4]UXI02016.1 spore coat U domain-containing protein [Photobacterium sp. TY1-4]